MLITALIQGFTAFLVIIFREFRLYAPVGTSDRFVDLRCQDVASLPRAAAVCQNAISYSTNNKHRMDYARFLQQGYFIGSGTIESAVKQIVGLRLKQAGARWLVNGAVHTANARST